METNQTIVDLQKELLRQWEFNHKEHCRDNWPHTGACFWEIPSAISSLSENEVCSILEQLMDRAF
jgi:hypothetical protein